MSPDFATLFVFMDERDVLGSTLTWDEDALVHCMADAYLLPRTLNLCLKLPTPEEVERQIPGNFSYDMKEGVCTLELLVSDRLEFSEKSLRRINRSLATLIRGAATHQMYVEFFGEMCAEVAYKSSLGWVDRISYAWSKTWTQTHADMLLLKVEEAAVAAE